MYLIPRWMEETDNMRRNTRKVPEGVKENFAVDFHRDFQKRDAEECLPRGRIGS